MIPFLVLPGLPAYGPPAENFSDTGQGKHREGLVVEFFPGDERRWVGNFQRGLSKLDQVLLHVDDGHCVVVAGGTAYIVNPVERFVVETFGGGIEYCTRADDFEALVFGNGLWFEVLFSNGSRSQTQRISWDGMRNLDFQGGSLSGEAYDPMQDTWVSFKVDLIEGTFTGGSYQT